MFSNMMKNNSHRVDYLNFKAIGMDDSFGIYVRGCLKEDQPYSIEAKRRLFTCLDFARQQLDEEKLVAVYMDIIDLKKSKNLAFQEMDADLKKGLFEKVLFADLEEIFADSELNEKIISLSESVEGIEFLDVQGNVFEAKKISLNQIIGV
jgi:hypothetical protein